MADSIDFEKKLSFATIKRLLKKEDSFTIKIRGASMEPYLIEGDEVVVKRQNASYQVGDLVLIEWGSSFVVHRLVELEGMRTKGDNLSECDPLGFHVIAVCQKSINRAVKE